ncbi:MULTISPECIES: helix-turn-helix transcriptional regulator [Kitasatospora]|uniref:Putative transcriptional regulator n=1 Tax=Kitasatospora setae (strain ATCC 33774 / DSM 43861 / JCM 3304 / KCC A-0304 / NBRC 14216 / KM-6054) TaxID=452652 RepID=E4N3Y5_KITSK|nr:MULTISPECIES: helix-turn-helix transcriptional regulator [Kitasatospora]BAJ31616.1 putative transcriptional regulator [Kitasatospora setae KM-6054]
MVGAVRQSVNGVDLGRALRELREASGKEAKAVARSALMSPSKLSKILNGKMAPSVADVERILAALDVPPEVSAQLAAAARTVATEATAWRIYRRSGLHKHQEEIRAIESQAKSLRVFQASCIPGLLQSPEYIRSILQTSGLSDESLEKMVGARVCRQEVLHESRRRFSFLVTESVLRWRLVRPAMMAAQLDKLVKVSRMANISVGVVPLIALMPEPPTCSFVLFDARMAVVEIPHAEVTARDPRDVEQYVRKYESFERVALLGDAMREFVERIRDEYVTEQETA